MTTFRTALLVIVAVVGSMTVPAQAESDAAGFWIVTDIPPREIDATKAALITEGMKFRTLVQILGPGWMTSREGVGVSRWTVTDGRQLNLSPDWHGDWKSERVSFDKRTGVAHVWWTPSSVITIHRGETKEGPRLP
jgi:hypothetical protein